MLRSLSQIGRAVPMVSGVTANEANAVRRVRPVQLVLKRNASIHTRHILVQKLQLEHITTFGISLLVSG